MSSRAGRLAALAVAGGLAMPLLAGACSVSVGPLQHRTSSYSVSGPLQVLVVHAHVGNVHVTGEAPGSKVTVTEHLSFRETAPVTTHRTAARVLTLSSTCPSLETCSVGYDLGIPRTMTVRITNSVGTIRLGSLSGPVTASTSAGTIELHSVSGPIAATGSAGSIVGDDISSARTIARVSTGQIKITFSAPPTAVRATTSAGLVLLRVPGNVGYAVDASTTVGSIRIGVQRSAASPHVITARATTGSIRIEPAS
jgi:hypothetical protein